jgi:hypothetical protein
MYGCYMILHNQHQQIELKFYINGTQITRYFLCILHLVKITDTAVNQSGVEQELGSIRLWF